MLKFGDENIIASVIWNSRIRRLVKGHARPAKTGLRPQGYLDRAADYAFKILGEFHSAGSLGLLVQLSVGLPQSQFGEEGAQRYIH